MAEGAIEEGDSTHEIPITKKRKINEDSDDSDSDSASELSDDSYGYTSDEEEEDDTETEYEITEPEKLPESISKLPNEVFYSILCKLPLKTLLNCRVVSKSWYTAFKNPNFIKLHRKKVMQAKSFSLIYHDTSHPKEFSLIDHEDLEAFDTEIVSYKLKLPRPLVMVGIMDSCNGLVCSRGGQPYFVCNPVTGEHMVIPKPPLYDVKDVVTGFGYDTVSEVFKFIRVIKVRENAENCATIAQLYNFSTGEWRLIPEVPYAFDKDEKSNVCVNGALHWLGYTVDKSGYYHTIIISFRFDSEEFKQVPMPIAHMIGPHLVVLRECLCIVREFRQEMIKVWIMKDYGLQSSWVEEYNIKEIKLGFLHPCTKGELQRGPYKPLQLMENGKLLMFCANDLGYYDPRDGTLDIIYAGTGDDVDFVMQPLVHIGSFITPNSI
ncbi:hypothetical protein ACHQM5_012707 [Ranunculus cassubicifolius]